VELLAEMLIVVVRIEEGHSTSVIEQMQKIEAVQGVKVIYSHYT